MNRIISEALASKLIEVEFISLTSGCVNTLRVGKKVRVPKAHTTYRKSGADPCDRDARKLMIPHSDESGIVYFEDLGSKRIDKRMWTGRLRMVAWLNMQKIGYSNNVDMLRLHAMSFIKGGFDMPPLISAGTLKEIIVDPKKPGPFNEYSYEEDITPYKCHPYDYYSCILEWSAGVNEDCDIDITITEEDKC